MVRAGQVLTSPHQRLIDLAIDFMQDDEYSSMPDLETDDEDQASINSTPNLGVQNDGIIECMHNITIMVFPNEVIRVNQQTGQIAPLCNIVRGLIEPTVPQLESLAVSDNGALEAFNMYEANDMWVQQGQDQQVNTCRQ